MKLLSVLVVAVSLFKASALPVESTGVENVSHVKNVAKAPPFTGGVAFPKRQSDKDTIIRERGRKVQNQAQVPPFTGGVAFPKRESDKDTIIRARGRKVQNPARVPPFTGSPAFTGK
ncbi:hypothetical protein BDP55DRAFT_636458 [Colletotrichum godetiae]|uniref:Uncharacterized protein n=1 Tax=Colletotrichum godetiae TaxID=1209918 RepID=A0AAJ0ESZ2_9PEZI|nr:uncharacterized protein BDP55DRAFT_636458 [Colletotrichum godetiae]KAK1659973.1 hypothetical protein BDP55DRAFT_636458 [Colletotrichum godetiae]